MTEAIASSQPSTSSDSNSNKKQCWVCFETEQDGEDVSWVSPCRCDGTMKWVHEDCIQRWIDEKQERSNYQRVSCSQCKTHYTLSYPKASFIVKLLETYDKTLYGTSPFVAVTVVGGSIYWCCGSFGFISIIEVMGYDEGRHLIDQLDPFLLLIVLPAIPISLILAKLIRWEDFILRLWRQNSFKLPSPFNYLIPSAPTTTRANCVRVLEDPGFSEVLGCTRNICGALLLPTISALVGRYLFAGLTSSQWRRSLLGGLAFLLVKGALKIYLRKTQYIRCSQRTVKNFSEISKTRAKTLPYTLTPAREGSGETRNQDRTQGAPTVLGANSNNPSDMNQYSNLEDSDDENDENDVEVRARTMFSINIQL